MRVPRSSRFLRGRVRCCQKYGDRRNVPPFSKRRYPVNVPSVPAFPQLAQARDTSGSLTSRVRSTMRAGYFSGRLCHFADRFHHDLDVQMSSPACDIHRS